MSTQKGFAWVPVLIGVGVFVVAVIAGGYVYVTQQQGTSPTSPVQQEQLDSNTFSATPTSGSAPLNIRFMMNGKANAFQTFDFGDGVKFSVGTPSDADNVSCTAAGPDSVCSGTHIYTTPGVYIAKIQDSSGNLLGSATITVTGSSQNSQNSVAGMSKYTDSDRVLSFLYPSDWTITGDITNGLYINPPGEADSVAGSGVSIVSSGGAYMDNLDGTSVGFEKISSTPDGTSYIHGNELVTKVKNVTIDGSQAVLENVQNAPGVATEPYQSDTYWLRRNNVNWYISISDYDPTSYSDAFDQILKSIHITN
jgi:hypothetical protein